VISSGSNVEFSALGLARRCCGDTAARRLATFLSSGLRPNTFLRESRPSAFDGRSKQLALDTDIAIRPHRGHEDRPNQADARNEPGPSGTSGWSSRRGGPPVLGDRRAGTTRFCFCVLLLSRVSGSSLPLAHGVSIGFNARQPRGVALGTPQKSQRRLAGYFATSLRPATASMSGSCAACAR
jgi:hypothetical protein